MKKIFTLLILIAIFIPNTAFGAFAVGWNATSTSQGWIWPNLFNGVAQKVAAFNFIASYFTATSTTQSNTFAGKVGIASSSPSSSLSVEGTSYFKGETSDHFKIETSGSQHAVNILRTDNVGVHASFNDTNSGFSTSDGFDIGYDTSGDAVVRNRENSAIRFLTSAVENAVLLANGFFGIGTTTPYAPLSVVGQVVGEYFSATSTIATSTISGKLNVIGGTQLGMASSSYSGSSLYVNQKTISTDPDTDPVVRIESFGDDTGEPLLSIVGNYRNGVSGARYRSEFHSANPGFLTNGVMLLNGPDNNNSGDLGDNKLSWNLKPDYFQFGQATQMLGISTDVAPYSSINVQQSHGPFLEGWSYANSGFQNSLVGRTLSINSTGKISSKTGYDVLAVNASSTFNGSFTAGGGSSFSGVPNIQERLVRIQGGWLGAQNTRNNSTLSLGYGFEVKQPVTVSQLGRYWASGNSLNHGLWLWDSSGSTLLASTTVLNSSTSDDNGYKWADTKYNGATITVDLVPNHMYYVTSDELSGGDLWLDKWSTSGANYASVFAEYMVSSTTPVYGTIGSFPTIVNGQNYQIWSSPAIRASSDASTRGFHVSSTTAYLMNHNFGIGTTTPGSLLSLGNTGNNTINISATATSTFGSGLNLRSGCFAINGTCISGGTVSSGGGSGNVATSTGETAGNLAYWTSTNGTPATLGKISTTTVTCSGDATCTPFTVIGNTPIDISATGGGGGGDFAWTPTTNYNTAVNATTTPIWFQAGLMASTTSYLVNASTTQLSASGSVYLATLGTDTTKVAIGATSSPSAMLSVYNPSSNTGGTALFAINDESANGFNVFQVNNGKMMLNINGLNDTVNIQSGGGSSIFGGNVGISTSSPYAALSVVGEAVARNFTATSTTATSTLQGGLNVGQGSLVTDFTTGITSVSSSIQGTMNFEDNAGSVQWADLNVTSSAPNGTPQKYEAMIDSIPMLSIYSESNGTGGIKNTGVGIGTSSPDALFAIQNTANAASSTYSFYIASTTAAFATTTHFVISNTGNVGLATTSPWRTLSVVGTAVINGLTTAAGTPSSVCINSTTKEITENAALTCTVSDEEQKSPLKPLDFSALDMISEIKPSSFSYNDQPDRLRYGFGAQSLQAVDPRLADGYDKDGIARSIDLPALTAINTKAIQELAAREDTAGSGGSTQDTIQWIAIALLAGWCTVLTIKRKQ